MIKGVLIGDPVDKSISHITHNEIFRKSGISGVYEKRVIRIEEVAALKQEEYNFLAVTMPLKEAILSFLDEGPGGPINTILVREGKWIGYNFDGIACLNAIERVEKVSGKRVLVLGAGGAAKSAISEAKVRGADVYVYNRTYERALNLGVTVLREVTEVFDVIIQATSVGMLSRGLPMDPRLISCNTIVMEMVYNPPKTWFVEEALKRGARVVFGYEMFAELTFAQFDLATCGKVDKALVHEVIKSFFAEN